MNQVDLTALDAKVNALLAIFIDRYLRETGLAKPRPRSIDRMLVDAGLTPKQVAPLLGKTEQAVYMKLQSEKKKMSRGKVMDSREDPEASKSIVEEPPL